MGSVKNDEGFRGDTLKKQLKENGTYKLWFSDCGVFKDLCVREFGVIML